MNNSEQTPVRKGVPTITCPVPLDESGSGTRLRYQGPIMDFNREKSPYDRIVEKLTLNGKMDWNQAD